MRVGFFGTPDLAAACLEGLSERHEVRFVMTAPDRPAGRHGTPQPSPVKRAALARGIPVLQPEGLRDPALAGELAAFGAEIFVIVAYGKIIPRAVFDAPPLRTINLHPSLLPCYRGAAPLPWAIMNGETETGITIQLINEELDAGDIVMQETFAIDEGMTAGDCFTLTASRGPALLDRAMTGLADGSLVPRPQDHARATRCGKIDKDMARVDWRHRARDIHNQVRGLNPRPVAHAGFRGEVIKLWRTAPFDGEAPTPTAPGLLAAHEKRRLLAGTGEGWLEVLSLQPAGKKPMDAVSFINGHRLTAGESFT